MAFIPTADLIAKPILNYVFDTGSMTWVPETQPGGSGGGGTSSTFGAAFPATGTAAGFRDAGGLMAAGNLDASGFLKVNVAAGGAGGGAMTVADGADVAEGATTDAAVITDAAGTVSGKLRGLVKWAFERMPASLGQKAMAASFPIVIASDQTQIPVFVQDFNSGLHLGVDAAGAARVRIFDSDGNDIAVASGYADSNIPRGFMVLNDDGTNLHSLKADTDGTTHVDLTKIGTAAYTLGQKVMASSAPVVIASDQSAVPISGTITTSPPANASTNLTQVGGAAVTLGAKLSAASIPVVLATDEAALPITAAALPLPAGAATSALQTAGNASLSSIDTKLTSPLAVTGPLTDAQLRATAVPVSGTITATIGSLANISVDSTGNISTDSYNAYRLQEKQYLTEVATQIFSMLNDEISTSHRMGYEVR